MCTVKYALREARTQLRLLLWCAGMIIFCWAIYFLWIQEPKQSQKTELISFAEAKSERQRGKI